MVMPPSDKATPDGALVSSYTLHRLGTDLRIRVSYMNVDNVYVPSVPVGEDSTDLILHIPAWEGREDIRPGMELLDGWTLEYIGTVVMWDKETADLELGAPVGDLPETVTFHQRTPANTLAYRPATPAIVWYRDLFLSDPNDRQYAFGLMVSSYKSAVETALDVLGIMVPEEDLTAAIMALVMEGTSLDSFFSEAAEQLELDSRAGLLPWKLS
jgi:hypothetical protein